MLQDLINSLELVKVLNKYSFQVGLFENASKEVMVKIVNTDGSESSISMTLNDVLYFTENGTLTIPRRPIIKKLGEWVEEDYHKILEPILKGILNGEIKDESKIEALLQFEVSVINSQIAQVASNIITSNSSLSSILKIEDENKYLFDLKELSKYIYCKLKQK